MGGRLTHIAIETLERVYSTIRNTHISVETLEVTYAKARSTHIAVEFLEQSTTTTTTTTTTTHTWETDFTEYGTGSPPGDWTEDWNPTYVDATVETTKKDRGLFLDLGGNIRVAVTWDDIIEHEDMEVLALVQAKDAFSTLAGGVGARLSGDGTTANGYVAYLDPAHDRIMLRRYKNGTATDLSTASMTIEADRWYWMRLRILDDNIKVRVWGSQEAEPGVWTINHTDSSPMTTAGTAGVCAYNADAYCEHFIVETTPADWPIPVPAGYITTSTTTTTTTGTTTSWDHSACDLLWDDFEDGVIYDKWGGQKAVIDASDPFMGAYCADLNTDLGSAISKGVGDRTEMWFSFAWKGGSNWDGTRNSPVVLNHGVYHICGLLFNSSTLGIDLYRGSTKIASSAGGILTQGVWYQIDCYVRMDRVYHKNGRFVCRVNGETVVDFKGEMLTLWGEFGTLEFGYNILPTNDYASCYLDNICVRSSGSKPALAVTTTTTTTYTTTTYTVTEEREIINREYSDLYVLPTNQNWGYAPWLWVDGSNLLGTTAGFQGEPRSYQQRLIKPYTIKKIRIYGTGYDNRDIKAFDLLASNTGDFAGEETTLLQVTDQTGWDFEWREWELDNDTAYEWIRLANIYGNNEYWMYTYEMELLAPATEVEGPFGPNMSGGATITAQYGNATAPNLGDGDVSTRWDTGIGHTSSWLQFYWPVGKIIKKIIMRPGDAGYSNNMPNVFTLLASNTGAFAGEEVTLLTIPSMHGYNGDDDIRAWLVDNDTAYKYYKFDPMSTYGSNWMEMGELEMRGDTVTYQNTSTSTTSTTTTEYDTWWTDFSEQFTDSPPSDWTEVWEAPVAAINVRADGQYGAKYLEIDHSTYGNYFARYDQIPEAFSFEVLTKVQFGDAYFTSGQDYFRIVAKQTGNNANKNGYELRLYPANNQYKIYKMVSGVASQIGATGSFTFGTGWHWVRFRVFGTLLKARIWTGQPSTEPGTWGIETTDSTLVYKGRVGLGSYNGDDTRVDYFGVGYGGSAAPTPADFVTTTTTTTTTTSTTTTGTTETPMEPATYIATGTLQAS